MKTNAKDYSRIIIELTKQDPLRVSALAAVHSLGIDTACIGAGFVRNLVWDHLHGVSKATPLNDIDVIYFDPNAIAAEQHALESQLTQQLPTLNWQVRNQALMHKRNGDRPYTSCVDAMGFWPEKETAVAIRQLDPHKGMSEPNYECVSAFGFESLFSGCITANPKRASQIFEQRVAKKGWLTRWPQLRVVHA